MAYTPTTWATGDTITASAMNKIENGIANAGSGVIITDNGTALDKTYAEIYDLVNSGTPCYIKYNVYASTTDLDTDYDYHIRLMPISFVYKYDTVYRIMASTIQNTSVSGTYDLGTTSAWIYQASVSTDYPTFHCLVYANSSALTKSVVRS